jgi:alpha-L-fucosidase 2
LPEIRRLLAEGKNNEAQELVDKNFICKGVGSGSEPFGKYQVLGDLKIKFDYADKTSSPANYKRELSLDNAIANCTYVVDGATYKREYFTSFGNDVSIIKLSANKPGKLNLTIDLSRPERSVTVEKNGELQMYGQLKSGTDNGGMQYLTKVKTQLKGGSLSNDGNQLVVKNATEVIIYVSAGTDFRGADYKTNVDTKLATALKANYAVERAQHIAKYQKLFKRVTVNLGTGTAAEELPIKG